MADIDATSNLLERLSDLEADLARVRGGKKAIPRVDLMSWTARKPANDDGPIRLIDVLKRSLREDWKGFYETLSRWATRIDEQFVRR